MHVALKVGNSHSCSQQWRGSHFNPKSYGPMRAHIYYIHLYFYEFLCARRHDWDHLSLPADVRSSAIQNLACPSMRRAQFTQLGAFLPTARLLQVPLENHDNEAILFQRPLVRTKAPKDHSSPPISTPAWKIPPNFNGDNGCAKNTFKFWMPQVVHRTSFKGVISTCIYKYTPRGE